MKKPKPAMSVAPRTQRGFTMVAVLLLVGLIATISATYLKHVVIEQQHSMRSGKSLGNAEAVHSGLQFAKQSLLSGNTAVSDVSVSSGEHTATLQVVDLPDNRARCQLQSLDGSGLGKTLLAEAARVPAGRTSYKHPDELPRLFADVASNLLMDTSVPKTYITGQTTLESTELSGLVVIQNTSALFLRDVIIRGTVVSEDVLVDMPFGDFDEYSTPMLLMDGSTRIEPASFLPGVAVVMPDGLCSTWTNDARIDIAGDVVAHTVTLNRPGVLRGNVACIAALELHADLDRLGFGRKPLPWAVDLDMGGVWDNEFMAFLPRFSGVPELEPISEFWDVVEGAKLPTVVKTGGGTTTVGGTTTTTTGGTTSVSTGGTTVSNTKPVVAADYQTSDGKSVYSGDSGRSGMNSSSDKEAAKAAEQAAKAAKEAAEQAAKAAEQATKEAEDAAKEAAKVVTEALEEATKQLSKAADSSQDAVEEASAAKAAAVQAAELMAAGDTAHAEKAAEDAQQAAEKAAEKAADAAEAAAAAADAAASGDASATQAADAAAAEAAAAASAATAAAAAANGAAHAVIGG